MSVNENSTIEVKPVENAIQLTMVFNVRSADGHDCKYTQSLLSKVPDIDAIDEAICEKLAEILERTYYKAELDLRSLLASMLPVSALRESFPGDFEPSDEQRDQLNALHDARLEGLAQFCLQSYTEIDPRILGVDFPPDIGQMTFIKSPYVH